MLMTTKYKKNFLIEMMYDSTFHDEKMLSFFKDLDSYIDKADFFFKNSPGDTTTVAVVNFNEQHFVIKRYNSRSFWHRLKLQFRKSHGFRSFKFASLLPQFDIQTVKPIAVIQKKIGFIKTKSYFISRYEKGISGCKFFSDTSITKSEWPETIDAILNITKKLKANGIYHGDYHFGNFVIVENKPMLLDFDRIKIVKNKKRFEKLHLKDLKNFYRYLQRNKCAHECFRENPKNLFSFRE